MNIAAWAAGVGHYSSSPLLRQMEFTYDTITHNIFELQFLPSPCNIFLLTSVNSPNFFQIDPSNNLTLYDQFEIKWSHCPGNHPAYQSDMVT